MNFDRYMIGGRLTRDPDLRFTANQTPVCNFGIARNRKYRTQAGEDREEKLFIDVVAWGKTGEVINQYFQKGDPIFAEGTLKMEEWEDKNGGGKRTKIVMNLEQFQFVKQKSDNDGGGGRRDESEYDDVPGSGRGPARGQRSTAPPRQPQRSAPSRAPVADPPFSEDQHFEKDDIPF